MQMFKDSNQRMNQLMDGKAPFRLEVIAAAQREFEGQIKLINAVVSAYGISSKNKRALKGLENMNIMDDTTAVDLMLGDPEFDKIKCPIQEKIIYRHDCLDYSGSHLDDCQGCEIGRATKEKLLPPKD
jgi:hypothetical protein